MIDRTFQTGITKAPSIMPKTFVSTDIIVRRTMPVERLSFVASNVLPVWHVTGHAKTLKKNGAPVWIKPLLRRIKCRVCKNNSEFKNTVKRCKILLVEIEYV
jgi:hypothetical protein